MYAFSSANLLLDRMKFNIPFATKIGAIAIKWTWIGGNFSAQLLDNLVEGDNDLKITDLIDRQTDGSVD